MSNKTVESILAKAKGDANKDKDIITGKGPFSTSLFDEFVNAAVNDPTYKFTSRAKDGSVIEMNMRESFVKDIKKTAANAGYPQQSEEAVYDTADIETKAISEAVGHIVGSWIETGRKFPLPSKDLYGGDIYLDDVPGGTKEYDSKNPSTGEKTGTTINTSLDSIKIRTKSPVPKHLVTKVRKDLDGNIIKD